jgi:hypothetical protein
MGPLFGHFGRDPVPSNIMKLQAPRVFRWTEHMNTPEIVSPEHHDVRQAYLADDEIPEGTLAFLCFCLENYSAAILESVDLFNDWAIAQTRKSSGDLLSDRPKDHEPIIGRFTTRIRGISIQQSVATNEIWVIQRVLDWIDGLSKSEKEVCRRLLVECGGAGIVDLKLERRLTRVGTYMAFE